MNDSYLIRIETPWGLRQLNLEDYPGEDMWDRINAYDDANDTNFFDLLEPDMILPEIVEEDLEQIRVGDIVRAEDEEGFWHNAYVAEVNKGKLLPYTIIFLDDVRTCDGQILRRV